MRSTHNIRIDFAPLRGAGPRCRSAGDPARYTLNWTVAPTSRRLVTGVCMCWNSPYVTWKDSWCQFDSWPHFPFRFFPIHERVSGTPGGDRPVGCVFPCCRARGRWRRRSPPSPEDIPTFACPICPPVRTHPAPWD